MKKIPIGKIEGFKIGQAKDEAGGTGVTVVISEEGATGAVDVRGGAPATRETDLLKPENTVEKVNAVVLSGGSAFGLEAASGVMRALKEQGVGFGLGPFRVPIVVGASLFDLNSGNPEAFPDIEMGIQAVQNTGQPFTSGNEGAGTGATISKLNGFENALKSGIGSCAFELGDLKVGAIVAVNAVGEIIEPSGKFLSGRNPFSPVPEQTNTTIGVILTNADLNKAQLTKVCVMAQDGLARVIWPAHTPNDGDALFAMSTNQVQSDVSLVGMLAADAVQQAILDAVYSAKPAYGYPVLEITSSNE